MITLVLNRATGVTWAKHQCTSHIPKGIGGAVHHTIEILEHLIDPLFFSFFSLFR